MPASALKIPQLSPVSVALSRITVRVVVSIPAPEPSLPSPRPKVTEAEPKYGAVTPVNVIDCPVGAAESWVSVNGTLGRPEGLCPLLIRRAGLGAATRHVRDGGEVDGGHSGLRIVGGGRDAERPATRPGPVEERRARRVLRAARRVLGERQREVRRRAVEQYGL